MIGYVYKIIHRTDATILPYIGSTKAGLSKRMAWHRKDFKRWKNGLSTSSCACYPSFDQHGLDNFIIIELARFDVLDNA